MSDPAFVHLRVHSAFSLAKGAIHLKDLAKRCRGLGMPAVAVTDLDNLFCALQAAKALTGEGIQPIHGAEISLAMPSTGAPKRPNGKAAHQIVPPRIVLLAQSQAGWARLSALVSAGYLDADPARAPELAFDRLLQGSDGLICLTGGIDGPIGQALQAGDEAEAEKRLAALKESFGDRLYVEVTRLGRQEEAAIEEPMIALADRLDVPLVATNDAYFLTPDRHDATQALWCIATGTYLSQTDKPLVSPEQYLASAQEMAERFSDLPDALANSVAIARRCAFAIDGHPPILPPFATGDGRNEVEELRHQSRMGLEQRLDQSVFPRAKSDAEREELSRQYTERLEYELGIIEGMGFPGYFLIVADFIQYAKANGIPVGPGRGSGAASVVAWSLTITDLDPIALDLLFERFLNPERVSMPAFDVDFCQDRRDEVISYVQRKYGYDRVAQIITFGKLQARAVLRDVGRVMQMPYGQVDRLCKLVPNNPANPISLADALQQDRELRNERDKEEQTQELFRIALQLEGLYRNASTHAAGVVIGDRPLVEWVPLYRDPRSDMPVTQFNMKDVETAGLVKFDFLGLKTLTVLQETLKLLREQGIEVDLTTLPLDDAKTYAMMGKGDTVGVFQLESGGMRDVLRQLKPNRFEDIIALVSLYRPGPMDNIPRYIATKEGKEEPDYMHPLLQPILEETFGIMIYQEQVMSAAQVLAGYSLGGADLLRRAMGKKIKEAMDAERAKFVDGAKDNGVDAGQASHIFDQIAKFAGYGFNKAHAAAYALIAYQTAWLKANHPVAFLAASMTLDLHNTDKLGIFKAEAQRLKIKVLPPSVNASRVTFSVERQDGEAVIRYALAAIKGVGEGAVQPIVDAREEGGAYKDIADFARRLDASALNKRILETLVRAGSLDDLEPNRRRCFDGVEPILRTAQAVAAEKDSEQVSLFGGPGNQAAEVPPPRLPDVPDWAFTERLAEEFSAVGFFLSAHPLDERASELAGLEVTPLSKVLAGLALYPKLAVTVLAVQERISGKGSRFAFVQASDPTGTVEMSLFSETLAEARPLLVAGANLYVSAEVQLQETGEVRVQARRVESLDAVLAGRLETLEIRLRDGAAVEWLSERLKAGGVGRTEILLAVPAKTGEEAVFKLPRRFTVSGELHAALMARDDLDVVAGC